MLLASFAIAIPSLVWRCACVRAPVNTLFDQVLYTIHDFTKGFSLFRRQGGAVIRRKKGIHRVTTTCLFIHVTSNMSLLLLSTTLTFSIENGQQVKKEGKNTLFCSSSSKLFSLKRGDKNMQCMHSSPLYHY